MQRVPSSLIWCLLVALAPAAARAEERATKLLALKLLPHDDGLLSVLQADGALEHRVVEEQNPGQRLILDVLGVSNPLRHYYPPENHPFLERVLMYEYPPATNPKQSGPLARIVFELKQDVSYRIDAVDSELHILFRDAALPPEEAQVTSGVVGDRDGDTSNGVASESPADAADPLVPGSVAIEPSDVPPSFFFRASTETAGDYRLGPEDVIDVRVFELDQLNRTVRVSGDDHIELPLVGRIRVSGLTTNEVAEEIANRLRDRFVQNPQVSIFITQFHSQKVSLLGAVATPSSYPLSGQRRLLQLLAEAGSLSPEAGSTLYVFRQTPDGRSARLTVPLSELLLMGDPRWNILLLPGDVVSVPPERAIAISVLGAVNSPGVHKLPVGDDATLLKAIALAGGLNERASKKGVQIKRRELDGKETVIKADLGDILSGKKPDIVLREGDVVLVKESFF